MKKINSKTVLLCGLIAVIVTILFYLLAFESIFTLPMRWLSLLCLLVVEILGTAKAHKVSKNIWGTTIAIVALLHLAAVLIVSLVFVNILPFLLKQYILLNLLLIAIVALIDILLMHFGQKAVDSNKLYAVSASVIDECLMKAKRILLETAPSKAYVQQIREIVDSLQYSNRSALSGCEGEIISKLDELYGMIKADDADAVVKTSRDIQNMLKLRTAQLKKSGSF